MSEQTKAWLQGSGTIVAISVLTAVSQQLGSGHWDWTPVLSALVSGIIMLLMQSPWQKRS